VVQRPRCSGSFDMIEEWLRCGGQLCSVVGTPSERRAGQGSWGLAQGLRYFDARCRSFGYRTPRYLGGPERIAPDARHRLRSGTGVLQKSCRLPIEGLRLGRCCCAGHPGSFASPSGCLFSGAYSSALMVHRARQARLTVLRARLGRCCCPSVFGYATRSNGEFDLVGVAASCVSCRISAGF